LKYYHAEQLTRLSSDMMRAIITIQAYIRMRLARARLKQRQYKHSNDMIIQELHRHPKFSRVCSLIFDEKLIFLLFFFLSQLLMMNKSKNELLFIFNHVYVVIYNVVI